MKLAAILCLRMNSSRLPGKALCEYFPGKSNLRCLVERARTSRHNPVITVATGAIPENDPIREECKRLGVPCYSGPTTNVVKLFDEALKEFCSDADYVWRVMGDCPLVDIGIMDWRVDVLQRNNADVMTIVQPEPTYAAHGSVWSREAWDYCAKMSSGSLLEHPGEYIYENLGTFKSIREPGPENVYYQDIRTELDTPEDLEFFRRIWMEYPPVNYQDNPDCISTRKVLEWLSSHPEITSINRHIDAKTKSSHRHGHHRARNWTCKECDHIIGYYYNDLLRVPCPKCGAERVYINYPDKKR